MSHEGFRFKDELYTTVTPPPVPERTPHVIPSTRPRMMSQADEQQFTEWFTTLIPKIDRKFPAGSTIKSE